MPNDERHYNINKLNVLFALSSVTLLAALGWMVISDYSRVWKDYQAQFRTLDIEKTRVKYDASLTALEESPEYQDLIKNLEQAQAEFEAQCVTAADAQKELDQLRAKNDLLQQNQKFTSAKLDAARYSYETKVAHQAANLHEARLAYNTLKNEIERLNLAVEQSNKILSEKEKTYEACGEKLKSVEREKKIVTNKLQILELKLKKIDPNQMNFINRIANMVRDLPVLDLANPNYKIEQIVLQDITEDVNFMKVPKVDRCITCHLGIDNPDYVNADQPFKTHPNLELYLGRESAHPMEEFGCTVCHGGRGRGTDFTSSAHSPTNKEQAKNWEEKYDWHALHHWEKPMLPSQYTQASCFKCHSEEYQIKGADKLNLGLQVIEKAGCYSCHAIEKYKDWPKPGPDLTKIASKVSKNWAYRWIENPHGFRHNTWMPAFFYQSNNSDPESVVRTQQEIHAIASYLFRQSSDYEKGAIPVSGDPARGEELVASVGCMGCHQIKPVAGGENVTANSLRREHGPNFIGIGTKTSEKWLYEWIKDPKRYHPGTLMPNLRLSDQEAADIASYLVTLRDAQFNTTVVPEINEAQINDIVFSFLVKSATHEQANTRVKGMDIEEKLHFAGEKLIRHYGCFSCHNISGFEHDKPIGTELTQEGDKSVHKLDFGFIDIDHTNYDWFTQKLKEPRIFDQGRVKAHDEKLRMPNFNFSDQEIEAVVTAMLGFVRERPESKITPRTAKNINIEQGQKLIRQMNCRGCHIIEGEGGTIQSSVKTWLSVYDNRSESEAEAIVTSFSPPNLIGEGEKVQAQWLFEFLHAPTTIRPWLKARMPTYDFNSNELNILLRYFSALDDEDFPFEEKVDTSLTDQEYQAAKALFSVDYFDCAKCHIVGNKLPDGSPDSWAPDFAIAGSRLKPEWIIQWIKDPQSLLPGTKMPNYFDTATFEESGPEDILDGNELEQIRVLRNYLLTLSDSPAPKASNAALNSFDEPPVPDAAMPTLPAEGDTGATPSEVNY